jgi:hypothetical protein
MVKVVVHTTKLSLLAQALTGIVGMYGLTRSVPPKDRSLKTSLQIEMFVQAIEFIFYVWFIHNFNIHTMAQTRYKDWIVTTPLMLISAMIYYYYEEKVQQNKNTENTVQQFWQEHKDTVVLVLVANFLMVFFGYLGETGAMSMQASAILGFVAFSVAFYTMYSRLASKSTNGQRLFRFIAVVWALYGVAFLFPVVEKNMTYNALDVVAKNFFGVYLAYKVIQSTK